MAADQPDGCGETITLPTDETVTCNLHKRGWHLARTRATWPEIVDILSLCGVWGVADTAEGQIFVMCSGVAGHVAEGLRHSARLGGMPKHWH